ncbi:ferritin-like domain-containing protein [Mycena filopes]|nr:ferritin-like domain-containing protein [Mycena filopes]
MYSTSILATVLAAVTVAALPAKREVTGWPASLSFFSFLPHLFSDADFAAAGFPDWTRGRFVQIAEHEATHVAFLTTALQTAGAPAVQACEYKFPVTDVHSFVSLARVLEEVGTNAYTGGAQLIQNKDYLTAAASILAVEGRHEAWISAAVSKGSAWDTAFNTPLLPNAVYTLAAAFIKSCPAANADALPTLTAYPVLAFIDTNPRTGKTVAIPKDLRGFVFCFVTTDGSKLDDSTTVAGPAILIVEFDSRGNVV